MGHRRTAGLVSRPPQKMALVRTAYRRCHAAALRALNALGLNVARTSDYYSPLPLRSRLADSRERWDRPSDMVGVDYDLAFSSSTLYK